MLHSLGGSADAAEQIVNLLRPRFESVAFIVPNVAKSAATLLALSGNRLYMDERSDLGPVDPQILVPQANGQAVSIPAQADVWLLEMCGTATAAAKELARKWLAEYMFAGRDDACGKAQGIADRLADSARYKSHGRPIGIAEATEMGLVVREAIT